MARSERFSTSARKSPRLQVIFYFFFLSLQFLHLWKLVRSLKRMTFSSTALTSELFVCRNQVIRTQKYYTCCQDPENELICELICAAMC